MSKTAKCERTGNRIPIEDGFFVGSPLTGEWEFVSIDAPEARAEYNVRVGDLVGSPAALVDWLAHLREKTWFKPDLFFAFFTRFRKENELYGCMHLHG
ncbi:MAG: hypothetical protein JW759_01870 [Candidatus Coatesbacteria bacterium]|nr:hypothetical protein [Candidatus Coatesbacteria bacterium]